MTKAATTFQGSIWSALADGMIDANGLTDSGRQTADRLAEDCGENRDAVRRDIEEMLAANPQYARAVASLPVAPTPAE